MKNPAFVGAAAGTVLGLVILKALGVELDPARAEGSGITITLAMCMLAGAGCMSALRHGLRGSGAGFWQSTVGRWLIGRMAGSAVYLALAALLWQPATYAVAYLAYGLIAVAGLKAVVSVFWLLPWAKGVMVLTGAWFLRTPAKVVIGKGSAPLRRWYRTLPVGCGGSAAFAGICEEWAHRYRRGMIFLGHSLFDRHWPVGMRDDRMVQTLAGTGGGKGESAIINNVLLHDGSLFVVDVKGQIAAVTAEALRAKGYTVHIIDHLNVLRQGTASIDPLNDLDPGALDYVERVKKIVEAMTIPTGERNRFFEEGGKTICAGAIDYLIRRQGEEFVPPEEFQPEEITNE
jgi:type IV secretory pathway TraG/TraD family ATPase VirD4